MENGIAISGCSALETESEKFDFIIRGATIVDGQGNPEYKSDLGIIGDRIAKIGGLNHSRFGAEIFAGGLCLAPGFIDVHTHDDLHVLANPGMLSKISQGVTTVIVGNCGISASPVVLDAPPPDPMNLLGEQDDFIFPRVRDYASAVERARPAVNIAALVGHTSLRSNQMQALNRGATSAEIERMKMQLTEALEDGAIGMSSGLAYASANSAPAEEVQALAEVLSSYDGIYTTHLRTEFDGIITAMEEAFALGRGARVPVIISHFKCAGANNWGRTKETIPLLAKASLRQDIACDCYPYAASSSTLDLKQVTPDFDIFVTWSESCPAESGKMLADIAAGWGLSLLESAKKLQPAGAVYHNMDEADVQNVLQYSESMIGSDGLPDDPHPHPRLWGTFPRVLGHYCRDLGLFELREGVRKMTGLPAGKFRLFNRGVIKEGNFADLVLFDPREIRDTANFRNPKQVAAGVRNVWVNGKLGYQFSRPLDNNAGKFLVRKTAANELNH